MVILWNCGVEMWVATLEIRFFFFLIQIKENRNPIKYLKLELREETALFILAKKKVFINSDLDPSAHICSYYWPTDPHIRWFITARVDGSTSPLLLLRPVSSSWVWRWDSRFPDGRGGGFIVQSTPEVHPQIAGPQGKTILPYCVCVSTPTCLSLVCGACAFKTGVSFFPSNWQHTVP